MKEYDVFISYSRSDLHQVKAIKDELERTAGVRCWMDLNGIESGTPRFTNAIIEGIENCSVFLFMRSFSSQSSKYALLELNYASEETDKHVVIVNIDDSPMSKEFRFLYGLTDTIKWDDVPQHDKLIRDIKKWFVYPKKEADVFIVYSRKDIDTVLPIYEKLEEAGIKCWFDVGDMYNKSVIVDAIKHVKAALFMSSVNSNASLKDVSEIFLASRYGKEIIPVRLDMTPYAESIAFDICNYDYVIYDKSRREDSFNELFKKIASTLKM